MSRRTVDAAECKKLIELLRIGRCRGCGGLIREEIRKPEDVDELLFERDQRGELIGVRCPKCSRYVKATMRERYF